jgi:hypothetical protein
VGAVSPKERFVIQEEFQKQGELDDQLANDVIFMVLSRMESPELAVAVLASAVARLARDDGRDVQWLREVVGNAYDLAEAPKPTPRAN